MTTQNPADVFGSVLNDVVQIGNIFGKDGVFGHSSGYRAMKLADYNWNNFQSPLAQVKGMREAGINPASMLQGSNVATQGEGANPEPFINERLAKQQMFLDSTMQMAQIDNLRAQTRNIEADTNQKGEQTKLISAQTAGQLKENQFIEKLRNNEIELGNVQISLGKADQKIKRWQVKEIQKNLAAVDKQIEVFDASIDKLRNDIKNADESINIQKAELKVHQAQTAIQKALANSQIKVNDEQIEAIKQSVKNAIVNGNTEQLNYEILLSTKAFSVGMAEESYKQAKEATTQAETRTEQINRQLILDDEYFKSEKEFMRYRVLMSNLSKLITEVSDIVPKEMVIPGE